MTLAPLPLWNAKDAGSLSPPATRPVLIGPAALVVVRVVGSLSPLVIRPVLIGVEMEARIVSLYLSMMTQSRSRSGLVGITHHPQHRTSPALTLVPVLTALLLPP
jgi:hypothetical protein